MKTLLLVLAVVFVAVPASAQVCTSQIIWNQVYTTCTPLPRNNLDSSIILGIKTPYDFALQAQQLELLRAQTELLRQQLPPAPPQPPKAPKQAKTPAAVWPAGTYVPKTSRCFVPERCHRARNWMDDYTRPAKP